MHRYDSQGFYQLVLNCQPTRNLDTSRVAIATWRGGGGNS